jgi:hypothetical protein
MSELVRKMEKSMRWKVEHRKDTNPNLIPIAFEQIVDTPFANLVLSRDDIWPTVLKSESSL